MKRLPIQIQPQDFEGGHGFLLRSLHRNGTNYGQVSSWLGLRWHRSVRSPDHLLWAWATGVDSSWLLQRLPTSRRVDGGLEHSFMGHRWRGAQCLRIQAPQVCPSCLRELGYCQAIWDLACVSVCTRHGTALIDRCIRCSQPLRWNRPATDICTCKRVILESTKSATADPLVLRWTEWIGTRLTTPAQTSFDAFMPGLPGDLTPDGLYRIVLALGVRTVQNEVLRPTIWTQRLAPAAMLCVLSRGLRRLAGCLTSQDWGSLREIAHEQTLERLEVNGVTEADRAIAKRIRRRIFGLERKGDPALRPRSKGQLELFVERNLT